MIVKVDSFLESIVPDFLNNRKNDMPLLWEALQKKDFATLRTMGHKLKGNAGSYGFDQMGVFGAMIETGAETNDDQKIDSALKLLEAYLQNIEVVFEDQ